MDPKASRQNSNAADVATRVTAVVVAADGGRTLDLCLRAALADLWVDELIIVDTGVPAAAASALRSLKADRRDVALLSAKGAPFAEAANLAANRARGRWLLFLDPSVVLKRGAAQRMIAAARGAPSPWAASARLLDSKGRERPSVRRSLPTPLTALFGAGRLIRAPRQGAAASDVGAVSGGLILMPRQDFFAVGAFGSADSVEVEALDLCRRIGLSGGAVRFAARAEAVQFGAADGGASFAREADGVARYLRMQARTPIERLAAGVSAWAFGLSTRIGRRSNR